MSDTKQWTVTKREQIDPVTEVVYYANGDVIAFCQVDDVLTVASSPKEDKAAALADVQRTIKRHGYTLIGDAKNE